MGKAGVRSLVLAAVVLLASCAAPTAPPPAHAVNIAPPPPPPPPPAQVATPAPPPDSCGAADLQYLIGHPRTEIPIPLEPSRRRVACTTCPVTMDYNPSRQTILYDAQTGLVSSVKCG